MMTLAVDKESFLNAYYLGYTWFHFYYNKDVFTIYSLRTLEVLDSVISMSGDGEFTTVLDVCTELAEDICCRQRKLC